MRDSAKSPGSARRGGWFQSRWRWGMGTAGAWLQTTKTQLTSQPKSQNVKFSFRSGILTAPCYPKGKKVTRFCKTERKRRGKCLCWFLSLQCGCSRRIKSSDCCDWKRAYGLILPEKTHDSEVRWCPSTCGGLHRLRLSRGAGGFNNVARNLKK